jgi:hypothetical protein
MAFPDDHRRHQPVAEDDDEQAPGANGVDEPIPVWCGGRGDPLGEGDGWGAHRHGFILAVW